MKRLPLLSALCLGGVGCLSSSAGDLAFSDPARVTAPPPHAIGFPQREPDFDALPGFQRPPPGYGEVAFYWWVGDPLTRERLQWQIDRLAGKGVMGLQINYAHCDTGGRSYGFSYPSNPPLFSEAWWELLQWFVQQAKAKGMAASLSDYTLGFGQGWYVDEVLRDSPDLNGATLEHQSRTVEGGDTLSWPLPESPVAATAYRLNGDSIAPDSAVDLRPQLAQGTLRWTAPSGRWQVSVVVPKVARWSLDPMNPKTGPKVIEKFFQRFEDRNPGEGGKGLNFFFSDELGFGVGGPIWTPRFADEFRRRKGYDLAPQLPALFVDIGPATPKVRLDYSDVKVALTEEGFFQPVFDWHQRRGMIYGCDHGGRGYDVTEFGDYFRTQRWNQGPGSDQPGLSKDVVKAKVASSIAHLYNRPRVWIEGYYGSGWGTTSAQLADATFANFALGYNLLTLHGLYYTTHGGWWEWAPPCNHFHMPYWDHMGEFMNCVQRLSFLLSQGHHRCDVAVLYPVAPVEAGLGGAEAVQAAFAAGTQLYGRGIDFDFMDFESLSRAEIANGEIRVSGEVYRALVLPAMKAIRFATLQRAVEFQRAGGRVVVLGAPPEASDRLGRNDPQVAALVGELKDRVADAAGAADLVQRAFPRDYTGPGYVMHRKIGVRDLYFIYGAPEGAETAFRATGKVELWDPWTGQTRPLPVLEQTSQATRLRLPLTEREAQLVVFSPGTAETVVAQAPAPSAIPESGDWEFELQPSLDNRWGDYHWPPTPTLLGAEVRQLRYAAETGDSPAWQAPELDDSQWPKVTATFGPQFWKLGPLPEGFDERLLVGLDRIDPAVSVTHAGKSYRWQPYSFSWRWGIEGDPGHQGYHGLKEQVSDEFLALGKLEFTATGSDYKPEPGGSRYYLWTSVLSEREQAAQVRWGGNRPAAIWLNHAEVLVSTNREQLRPGANPLLLRYDRVGRGFAVVDAGSTPLVQLPPVAVGATQGSASPPPPVSPLAMSWYKQGQILPFDFQPAAGRPAGWYRFTAPPGLRAFTLQARGTVRAWADGKELARQGDRFLLSEPAARSVRVALRIEQERGAYGGAALLEPIRLDCGPGRIPLGDWSANDGLASYSGGAWYRKTVRLPGARRTVLDLGNVAATAEVRVNGTVAGVKVAPPWTLDVSAWVKPGDNRIEVLVYNTLANHYVSIPTRYRGKPTSGLLGPVSWRLEDPVK